MSTNVFYALTGPGPLLSTGAEIAALHDWTLSRSIMENCDPVPALQGAYYGLVHVARGATMVVCDSVCLAVYGAVNGDE